jgi:glycolate oxidase FAD binding subunit
VSDCLQLWSERIRAAAAARTPLRLQGGGTKSFYGNAAAGELLDTRAHSGVVSYEPSELVLTARCGTPLSDIESLLAAQGQMLAFEPPHFGAGATLGGCISAGLAGPRRVAAGAVRDFVLGIEMIDGRGDLQSFGGQVMKNVAGYDVSRLICGALGTLGLITRVSLKVLPRPIAELSLQFEMSSAQALNALAEWGQLPLPLSASAVTQDRLRLRLSGAGNAVAAARRQLGGEVMLEGAADEHWRQLREHTLEFFTRANLDAPLWRLSVPPTAPPLNLAGPQLIEWHGAQRWIRSNSNAAQLRAIATAVGGHATLFRGDAGEVDAFTVSMPVLMQLQLHLKHSFDPHGVLNPGRLYRDF